MTADPGLDVARLRALRKPRHELKPILDRIGEHLQANDGYVAMSGGKDSTAVVHLARQVDANVPVVFFDSGLEFPETYDYLAGLAEAWDLNIDIVTPARSALEVMVADGSWDHHCPAGPPAPDMFTALIAAPAAEAHRRHGPGELWGVRAAESAGRRMAYELALRVEAAACCCCDSPAALRSRHGGLIRRADGTVAYGPVWDWTTGEVWAYLARNNVPANPVYAKLGAMGVPEDAQRVSYVIDANQLEHGRAVWLKRGWPDLYEQLREHLPRLAEWT